ncbi:MAG: cytochrome c [Phycisphaerales bacterium]
MMKRHLLSHAAVSSLALGLLAAACSRDRPGERAATQASGVEHAAATSAQTAPTIAPPTMIDASPRDYAGLHNVVAFHDGFYSGSVPEGGAGFDTLRDMGIRTIISVDGAEPDLALARARGLRYIHLPIGYNGFDEQRRRELVRATRDAMNDGPVYIHCHHGKHRSAGAAGTIAASLGWATPAAMVERMQVSGTALGYKGLYACTAGASILAAPIIDATPAHFPEVSHPHGFVKAMVEADDALEHLREIEQAGWTVPKDHPDLVPAAEAGLLADLLRLMSTSERAAKQPADFAAFLQRNSDEAATLESLLAAGEQDDAKLSAQFKLIGASCKECHVKYRD